MYKIFLGKKLLKVYFSILYKNFDQNDLFFLKKKKYANFTVRKIRILSNHHSSESSFDFNSMFFNFFATNAIHKRRKLSVYFIETSRGTRAHLLSVCLLCKKV